MISISEKGCEINDISLKEALTLLAVYKEVDYNQTITKLKLKGLIIDKLDIYMNPIGFMLTDKGSDLLLNTILDSEKNQKPEDTLYSIAKQLKEIFPKGKKEGTNMYWADGIQLIVRRLQLFFKKYGSDYTDEQIIKAAKKYVQDQNGNYRYMKLLKYFILKEKQGVSGDIEGESTLLNYIENEGQSDLSDDWTSDIK